MMFSCLSFGTFQFKRKYPNGEPGAPVPTPIPPQPTATQPWIGPRLEVADRQIRKFEDNSGGYVLGYVKHRLCGPGRHPDCRHFQGWRWQTGRE